ncbi:hypothetical protein Leryth_004128 [Lithospermum erythrorhizon]|nr:hypothetical protein Leryth_004128 [Lithospermum erythrorhizon]
MTKDESPKTTRRMTRLSLSATSTPNLKNGESSKGCDLEALSVHDLVYDDIPFSLEELINVLPARRGQIVELIRLIGPLDCPMNPLFVYGGPSTGKTSTILNVFRYLNRPFVYSSLVSCYNPRILFENVLNQVLLHRKNKGNRYSSAKRCDKPSDFVNLLRDALPGILETLKGNSAKSCSKKSGVRPYGKMVYIIIDNLELARAWDNSSNILPFLFKLNDLLKMPEVGIILISRASPDIYYSDTGYVEPVPVFFPDYTEDDLRLIFMKDKENPKLYSSFLDVVLKPYSRITRRIDELSTAFLPLFTKYCEPLGHSDVVLSEDMKRKLFSHLQPHIAPALNKTFTMPSQLQEASANKESGQRKGSAKKFGVNETSYEMDFHMSTSAKYLLISAFLASRNPATLDASLFDSTGGLNNQKRKRKSSEKAKENKEMAEQEVLMKGPGSFPLERLLAIFQCITSVTDYLPDDEEEKDGGHIGNGLMTDVLLQLSSLCNANFISKGTSCPLEGSTRYRSTIPEELALKVARSLKFPLSRYIYRG